MVSSGLLRRVAPHGVTTQKTPFFIVTAVKTSNLTFITQIHYGDVQSNKVSCSGLKQKNGVKTSDLTKVPNRFAALED
jgi:hypothetical protein